MSDKAWLKQVLADAKAAQQSRPAWAQAAELQTSLNAHPVQQRGACEAHKQAQPIAARSTEHKLDLK